MAVKCNDNEIMLGNVVCCIATSHVIAQIELAQIRMSTSEVARWYGQPDEVQHQDEIHDGRSV